MKKRITALVLAALFVALLRLFAPAPPQVLRLQVVAASDSDVDQALKLRVKNALVSTFSPRWQGAEDAREAAALAQQDLAEAEALAEMILKDAGRDYGATAEIGIFPFPEKTYRGVVYPAGPYRALRVTLGQGQGRNWWCVLYPPLCLDDPDAEPVYHSWLLERFGIRARWKGNSPWKK